MARCRFFPIYIQKGPSAFFWFSVNTKFPFFTYVSAVHPVLQTNGINGGEERPCILAWPTRVDPSPYPIDDACSGNSGKTVLESMDG